MLRWKIKSTAFLDEIRKRRDSFQGRNISVTLKVPPQMKWWYWLEFGTAGTSIDPLRPAYALRWFDEKGFPVLRDHVNWPGIRPRAFVRKALPDVRSMSISVMHEALLEGGFRWSVIKSSVGDVMMPNAMEIIAQSLEKETKTTARTDSSAGIPGLTAGDAFRDNAYIEKN